MGEPMDRSQRVFGKLSTFEKVFPTLEDAEVNYEETDLYGNTKRSGRWFVKSFGGLMPCGNSRCRRGGYELDREMSEMIRGGVTEKKVKLECQGDEGSQKGRKRGQKCLRTLEATITLKFKLEATTAPEN